jgi:putative PEP-CTERM system TPR-repeat lipoprotein
MQTPVSGYDARPLGALISRLIGAFVGAALVVACTDPQVKKKQYFESGNGYFDKKMYGHAIVEYRNAIALDATFGEARKKLAEALTLNGEAIPAFGEYVRAADLLPNDVDAQIQAGTLLLGARKPQEALQRAEAALKVDPDNVEALVLRGSALSGLTSYDEALKAIEGAIQLDPLRGRTYSSLAFVQLAQGDREKAEAAFRRAVEMSPKDVQVHMALGNFYWTDGRAQEAERAFLEALKLDPANPPVNRFMASLVFSSGRRAEAEQYLLRIVDSSSNAAGTLALSDYYLMMDRPKDAIARLEKLPNARVPAVLHRLARAYSAAGDHAKAQALVDEALQANPKDAAAQVLKSTFLINAGRYDEALTTAQAAAAADPLSADAQYVLGRLYAIRGDDGAARTAFQETIRINPRAAVAQVALASVEAQTGQSEEATRLAAEVVKSQPGNLIARLVLVRNLIATRAFPRATQEIKALVASHPDNAAVRAQEGRFALATNDLATARAALQRAYKLDPMSFEVASLLVSLDLRQNNRAAAKARIEELVTNRPTTDVLLLAARTYTSLKETDSAEKMLLAAIKMDPALVTPYELLGWLYLNQNKTDQALSQFETLAKKQSRPVEALTMAGMILRQQGKNDLARARYEQALGLDPNASTAANNLAWMLAEAGEDLDRAVDLAKVATAASPDVPAVMDTLGWAYVKKREPQLAIPLFQRCVQLDPGNGWYHYHLGLAYDQAGDSERARASFQRALHAGTNAATAAEINKVLTRTTSSK